MPNIEPHHQHLDAGGWISGSMEDVDPRPEYSPTKLMLDVIGILAESGIGVDPSPGQLDTTTIACAAVLRGLGVRPIGDRAVDRDDESASWADVVDDLAESTCSRMCSLRIPMRDLAAGVVHDCRGWRPAW